MANITILPQSTKSRLAEQMGQSIAEGLAKRMPRPEHETIRKQQRGALDEFKGMLTPQDTPADIALKFAQSTAGIPGAENWAQSILPAYQMQAGFNVYGNAQNPYGNNPSNPSNASNPNPQGMGGAPLNSPSNFGSPNVGASVNSPSRQPSPQMQPGSSGTASLFSNNPQSTSPSNGGVGLTPSQGPDAGLYQRAKLTGQTPTEALAFEQGVPQQQVATEITKQESERYDTLAKAAEKYLSTIEGVKKNGGVEQVNPENIRRFIDIGKKYQGADMATWLKKTGEDYKTFKDKTNAIEKFFVPGFFSRFYSKDRQSAVKDLHREIKPLIDMGEEQYARELLTGKGLGPTEIGIATHPLNDQLIKEIKPLPKLPESIRNPNFGAGDKFTSQEDFFNRNPKMNQQIIDKTANFLLKDLKDGDSLLAIRDHLMNDKGYTWNQFLASLNQARDQGLQLDARQEGELGNLSQPPRDSLASIFYDLGNWSNIFKGAK